MVNWPEINAMFMVSRQNRNFNVDSVYDCFVGTLNPWLVGSHGVSYLVSLGIPHAKAMKIYYMANYIPPDRFCDVEYCIAKATEIINYE